MSALSVELPRGHCARQMRNDERVGSRQSWAGAIEVMDLMQEPVNGTTHTDPVGFTSYIAFA